MKLFPSARLLTLLVFATLGHHLSAPLRAQGSLTPPAGPPAPAMKTLDQIEPRKPVQSLAAAAPYTISQPGSYYLTGNITVASGDAIIISSDDVPLDLNGFTIRSTQTGGASGRAVSVPLNQARLTVRNGSIVSGTTVLSSGLPVEAGFVDGISSAMNWITQCLISEVHVTGVSQFGIYIDFQGVVDRCTASHCRSGIIAQTIRDCSAKNCYMVGISAKENATNCIGNSDASYGLHCVGNATNCTGTSHSSIGLYCLNNATNCTGTTGVGAAGLKVTGTASFCRGEHSMAGIALQAGNAIGCTVNGGTVSAPLKSLGTP